MQDQVLFREAYWVLFTACSAGAPLTTNRTSVCSGGAGRALVAASLKRTWSSHLLEKSNTNRLLGSFK